MDKLIAIAILVLVALAFYCAIGTQHPIEALLVIVNLFLVVVTLIYARSTRDIAAKTTEAAQAAERSAQAAEGMLSIERERQSEEKRMVAGVLVSELYACCALIKLALNPERGEPQDRPSEEAISWSFDSPYMNFFDRAGARLFLLGPDLLQMTVECYGMIRRTLDEARQAQRLAEDDKVRPSVNIAHGTRTNPTGELAKKAHDSTLARALQALYAIGALLPELSEVAQIENPLQPTKSG